MHNAMFELNLSELSGHKFPNKANILHRKQLCLSQKLSTLKHKRLSEPVLMVTESVGIQWRKVYLVGWFGVKKAQSTVMVISSFVEFTEPYFSWAGLILYGVNQYLCTFFCQKLITPLLQSVEAREESLLLGNQY